jgi:hypothetical protein
MIVIRRLNGVRGLGASDRACATYATLHDAGSKAIAAAGDNPYAQVGGTVANMLYGVLSATACAPKPPEETAGSSSSELLAAQQLQFQQQQAAYQQQLAAQEAERRAREDASKAETKKIALYVGSGLAVVVGGAILWKILA